MKKKRIPFLILLSFIVTFASCSKFLEKKALRDLEVPSSIRDLQGLLNNASLFNSFPHPAEILSDDYYLTEEDWEAFLNVQNDPFLAQFNLATWQDTDNTGTFWNVPYQSVLTANIVLDELSNMDQGDASDSDYNTVKGSALFYRAVSFYHTAQVFAVPYRVEAASNDFGIVLRLNGDINEPSERASVAATYNQIIKDLKVAAELLPLKPYVKTQPSKPAAYGALARTYLIMGKYDDALIYANKCLGIYDSLLNYNELNVAGNNPIEKNNREVIFAQRSPAITSRLGTRAKVDSNLYKSYADNDLRKQAFFKPAETGGGYNFKGDYDGIGLGSSNNTFYSYLGIVTDELYLIRAECLARNNYVSVAMETLNALLITRYKTGHFTALQASTPQEALTIILQERRKELLRRGTRWTDIRRFIKDEDHSILPKRIVKGREYAADKGNKPYLLLIPLEVMNHTNIPQNVN